MPYKQDMFICMQQFFAIREVKESWKSFFK